MNIGRLKFIVDRLKGYGALLSTGLLLDMWISQHGFSWWYIGPGLLILATLVWKMDKRHVAPGETASMSTINPEWNKLVDMVKELKRRSDESGKS